MGPERILLTNDDGLHSNGMLHLEKALSKRFEVWAVCPDRQRSATSQAISIHDHLRLTEVQPRHFTVNGFPADCVNVALYSNLFPAFDLVVSGINHGFNMGDDVHYSGTVGAARHAAVHKVKAVAASSGITDTDGDFHSASEWLCNWIQNYFGKLRSEIVYNLNFPAVDIRPNTPVEYTTHGRRLYLDAYEVLEESPGQRSLALKETVMGRESFVESDFHAVEQGRISMTPLSIATTHEHERARWKKPG